MNLFIDTISSSANVILFDSNRNIIDNIKWYVKGNESSTLIPQIDQLLKNNNFNYDDLENIIVVNGPGSFTGIRTTVLAANSINYIIKKNLSSLSFFELYNSYPIIKASSKHDHFLKLSENSEIEIISNEELLKLFKKNNIKKAYGEANNSLFDNIEILENIDYISIIKDIKYQNLKQIDALYIKKPNIS